MIPTEHAGGGGALRTERDRQPRRDRRRRRRPHARDLELLVGGMLLVLAAQGPLAGRLDAPWLRAWASVFLAVCVQALPFLVLGTVISAAIAVYVPASFLERALPKREALAVPLAGVAGAVLPGCECASVPVAGRLMARGVAPSAALAFLLSAPAVNPVVLTATAVAFPGRPMVVLARFAASLATAAAMGWLWARFGRPEWLRPKARGELPGGTGRESRRQRYRETLEHDFLHAGGWLVVGGLTAATLNVLVPRGFLEGLGGVPVVSVLVMAVLAVLLAVCSEADAFVAASLTAFPMTARLAFMVVGPMVDVKLFALQTGTFGRDFAWRFSAATLVTGVVMASLVGWWLL
ncbi:permease [Streptomyces sp. NPDC088354]|uniref:permease n=1 Tax=Streptomyces sp. NPDC088354 TaxID=3365856 RepID=UPI0038115B7A